MIVLLLVCIVFFLWLFASIKGLKTIFKGLNSLGKKFPSKDGTRYGESAINPKMNFWSGLCVVALIFGIAWLMVKYSEPSKELPPSGEGVDYTTSFVKSSKK